MILIAIGANLPGPDGRSALHTCRSAAEALCGVSGLRCTGISRWYATAPVPPSGQPPYVNGVARLEGVAEPWALLAALQAIETRHGRVRGLPNAARTLDLDLIDLDGMRRDGPDPVLPHPRMHERAFVLRPLLDVAPDWRHPRSGLTATALLAALADQGVELLAGGDGGVP